MQLDALDEAAEQADEQEDDDDDADEDHAAAMSPGGDDNWEPAAQAPKSAAAAAVAPAAERHGEASTTSATALPFDGRPCAQRTPPPAGRVRRRTAIVRTRPSEWAIFQLLFSSSALLPMHADTCCSAFWARHIRVLCLTALMRHCLSMVFRPMFALAASIAATNAAKRLCVSH
jgi:hypothetical protein